MSVVQKTGVRRKRIVVAVLGVLGLCAAGLAISVKSTNDTARERVVAACARLREPEAAKMDEWRRLAPSIFAEDSEAALVHVERAWFTHPYCAPLEAELSGLTWNFGRRWQPPSRSEDPSQELAEIWKRARPRCETRVEELLVSLSGLSDQPLPEESKTELRSLCDPEAQAKKSQPITDWPPTLLEGWPALLEKRAESFGPAEPAVEPF